MQYIKKQPDDLIRYGLRSEISTHNANCVGSVAQMGLQCTARQSLPITDQPSTHLVHDATTRTIISVKRIPMIGGSELFCSVEQPSALSERVEIELGGSDDDIEYDRDGEEVYDALAQSHSLDRYENKIKTHRWGTTVGGSISQ
jgi:hypothetical protein